LNVKMDHIEAWTEGRRAVAARYESLLASECYGKPAPHPQCRHVYHVYAVQVSDRDAVQKALQTAGVGTGIHYPVPVHLQKAYANLGYRPGDLPVTEALAQRFLSLPMYPELGAEQIAEVVTTLRGAATGLDPVHAV